MHPQQLWGRSAGTKTHTKRDCIEYLAPSGLGLSTQIRACARRTVFMRPNWLRGTFNCRPSNCFDHMPNRCCFRAGAAWFHAYNRRRGWFCYGTRATSCFDRSRQTTRCTGGSCRRSSSIRTGGMFPCCGYAWFGGNHFWRCWARKGGVKSSKRSTMVQCKVFRALFFHTARHIYMYFLDNPNSK